MRLPELMEGSAGGSVGRPMQRSFYWWTYPLQADNEADAQDPEKRVLLTIRVVHYRDACQTIDWP